MSCRGKACFSSHHHFAIARESEDPLASVALACEQRQVWPFCRAIGSALVSWY